MMTSDVWGRWSVDSKDLLKSSLWHLLQHLGNLNNFLGITIKEVLALTHAQHLQCRSQLGVIFNFAFVVDDFPCLVHQIVVVIGLAQHMHLRELLLLLLLLLGMSVNVGIAQAVPVACQHWVRGQRMSMSMLDISVRCAPTRRLESDFMLCRTQAALVEKQIVCHLHTGGCIDLPAATLILCETLQMQLVLRLMTFNTLLIGADTVRVVVK